MKLLYGFRRLREHRLRDGQAHGAGSLEIDDEIEFGGLLDWEVSRLRALEDLVDVGGRAAVEVGNVGSVAQETAGLCEQPLLKHCRQAVLRSQLCKPHSGAIEG